ncbi:MAG: DUF1819 family protein [Verrucomicrobia bacterium]|nr:DUF1819 family protein [Verrucomicrobiota bacterium]
MDLPPQKPVPTVPDDKTVHAHPLSEPNQQRPNPGPISSDYNLGFTAASLRPELARIVAECYLKNQDWHLAKEWILSSNALQCRTSTSANRLERELRHRLATLTQDQLILLSQATNEDRTAIAWIAALKRIPFAFEFAAEVLRDKLACQDLVLRHSDYEGYVESKKLIHAEIAQLSPLSSGKVRRVLMRMLAEVGLIEKGTALGTIHRPVVSPEVVRAIISDSPHWLAGFLVPDAEIPNF